MKTIGMVGGVGSEHTARRKRDRRACVLAVAKEISNIGMGFLRQFLALDMPHGTVKYPIVVPRTDDNWHGDRMPHEQCLLLRVQAGEHTVPVVRQRDDPHSCGGRLGRARIRNRNSHSHLLTAFAGGNVGDDSTEKQEFD